MFRATISVVRLRFPSRSSHSRVWIVPSMKMRRPLRRYLSQISASRLQTTIWCHSVRRCLSPFLSVHDSSVAREKLATGVPDVVYRTSGSRPSLPTKIALLTILNLLPHSPLHYNARPRKKRISDWNRAGPSTMDRLGRSRWTVSPFRCGVPRTVRIRRVRWRSRFAGPLDRSSRRSGLRAACRPANGPGRRGSQRAVRPGRPECRHR